MMVFCLRKIKEVKNILMMLHLDSGQLTRVAIVGYGLIGQRHAEVIKDIPGIELVAIVEPDATVSLTSVESFVTIFSDINQMLEQAKPDGVIIASPTKLHASHAGCCVAARVPVLIEKPISNDLNAARKLIADANEANLPLLVGHHRRYNSIIRRAHDLIESGEIGEVRAINAICWFYKPDHYFDSAPWRQKTGAGPVSVNLIHDVDLMRYLCGEVATVQAQFARSRRGFENEDVASAILEFKNGAIATLTVSDSIASPWSWEFSSRENPAFPFTGQSTYFIGGSKGSMSLPNLHVWKHEGGCDWWNPMACEEKEAVHSDPLTNQLVHFRRVILGIESPLVSGIEGTRSLEVIDAIQRAAITGELVQLDVSQGATLISSGLQSPEVIVGSQ